MAKEDNINKTQLNRFDALRTKNKEFLDQNKECNVDDDFRNSMAICMSVLEEYFKLNQYDAYNAITDGGGDCKIDALYYSDDEDELSEIVVIQSKYKQESGQIKTFTEDDINLCINNCIKIVTGKSLEKPNDKLQKILTNYLQLLEENDRPSISVKLFFATNGIIHGEHKKLTSVTEAQQHNIDCIFIDATEFGHEDVIGEGILQINMKDLSKKTDRTDSIFKTKANTMEGCIVSCKLKSLMKFYENTGKRALLCSNVRYLLPRSSINKAIKDSFVNNPEEFCFLHNGITLICSDYKMEPTGSDIMNLTLTEPNIVNGGQTIAILYDLYKNTYDDYKTQFEKANVVIRLYKASSEQSLRIAQATNSQNPIKVVDLKSNDPNQAKVKKVFEKFGIGLIVKQGEDTLYYDNTITNENLLQIYASLYENDPSIAKRSKGATFKKYFNDVFSDESLRENISEKLCRCYEISDFLRKKLIDGDEQLITNAWYSIIYTMKNMDNNIINENIPTNQIQGLFETSYPQAMEIIENIVKQKQYELGDRFSLNNLFKSNEIKSLIDIKIEKK
ncbi:MAG: AIPR family protein [Sedimentisphaerales bacterium]|nr:AIPR family protein [Sedimentisphaerales bacterium]